MSMQLASETLLRREIERLENKLEPLDDLDKIWLSLCKKELIVIEQLKINSVDLRGDIGEMKERLEKQSLYFMDAGEFEEMKRKARKYDEICNIISK